MLLSIGYDVTMTNIIGMFSCSGIEITTALTKVQDLKF